MRKEKSNVKRRKGKKASSKTKTMSAYERALGSESSIKLFVLLFIHRVKAREILVPCTVSK